MLKIGRIPAALFFAANFFALAAGANPQNAHSPTAPFVDSAQILKAGSKIRKSLRATPYLPGSHRLRS